MHFVFKDKKTHVFKFKGLDRTYDANFIQSNLWGGKDIMPDEVTEDILPDELTEGGIKQQADIHRVINPL